MKRDAQERPFSNKFPKKLFTEKTKDQAATLRVRLCNNERNTSSSRGSHMSDAPRLIASAHSLSSASLWVPTMQRPGNS